MSILCIWHREGEYNNCTCHTILRLFSNRTIKCNGKPESSKSGGGGDLPTIKLLNSKGEIVDAYPCRSYRPRPEEFLKEKSKESKDPILIVDDDEEICKTLARLLKLEGYEQVHTATSSKEAIARIKVMKYDFILLDIRMPEMNGVEVLREIRKYDEKVPVAIMSAYEDMDLAQEAFRLGAYDFIKKPIDHDYLKASILSKLIPGDTD